MIEAQAPTKNPVIGWYSYGLLRIRYPVLDVELAFCELVGAEEGAVGGNAAAYNGEGATIEATDALVAVEQLGSFYEPLRTL